MLAMTICELWRCQFYEFVLVRGDRELNFVLKKSFSAFAPFPFILVKFFNFSAFNILFFYFEKNEPWVILTHESLVQSPTRSSRSIVGELQSWSNSWTKLVGPLGHAQIGLTDLVGPIFKTMGETTRAWDFFLKNLRRHVTPC